MAADALGRVSPGLAGGRPLRLGRLLETLAGDRYPAVREIAWRSFRRLTADPSTAELVRAAGYDPAAPEDERRRALSRLLTAIPGLPPPAPDAARTLAGRLADQDLEIGE